jgi:hypothetical protein
MSRSLLRNYIPLWKQKVAVWYPFVGYIDQEAHTPGHFTEVRRCVGKMNKVLHKIARIRQRRAGQLELFNWPNG